MLLLAHELLHYRPIDDLYEECSLTSPRSSAPQGALPRHPSRYLALRQAWATQLRERVRHLSPKTVPWLQGAWPLDVTHRVQRPRDKKEAAKKSLGLKKAPPCSLRWHGKIACSLRRRCASAIKSKPHVSKGPP